MPAEPTKDIRHRPPPAWQRLLPARGRSPGRVVWEDQVGLPHVSFSACHQWMRELPSPGVYQEGYTRSRMEHEHTPDTTGKADRHRTVRTEKEKPLWQRIYQEPAFTEVAHHRLRGNDLSRPHGKGRALEEGVRRAGNRLCDLLPGVLQGGEDLYGEAACPCPLARRRETRLFSAFGLSTGIQRGPARRNARSQCGPGTKDCRKEIEAPQEEGEGRTGGQTRQDAPQHADHDAVQGNQGEAPGHDPFVQDQGISTRRSTRMRKRCTRLSA